MRAGRGRNKRKTAGLAALLYSSVFSWDQVNLKREDNVSCLQDKLLCCLIRCRISLPKKKKKKNPFGAWMLSDTLGEKSVSFPLGHLVLISDSGLVLFVIIEFSYIEIMSV